ncbi:MAG TPA: LLM class flavin-dependent oxidoreductase [Bacteroidia bacterium]
MEVGIDSFLMQPQVATNTATAMAEILERIELADQVGVDVFGIGEHHRSDFLDSAPPIILAAAAARTSKIKLASAVTVLSAADPVRIFQEFATLDIISKGRAEIVAGRGSFVDAFPLFGFDLNDYDDLFSEKLDLLLKIRDNEKLTWSGKFRPSMQNQGIYPRPVQKKLPIWLGVGGTPESFARAGQLGLPLMIAIIGGETGRFKPLVDLYKQSAIKAGHSLSDLKVGVHSLGFVGEDAKQTRDFFFAGYKSMFENLKRNGRSFGPVDREMFDFQNTRTGALLVGTPEEVAEKIILHSQSLGGVSRFTFQMDAILTHKDLMKAIELIGTKLKPLLKDA